jgi:UDP-glucuronate 4-epimerase
MNTTKILVTGCCGFIGFHLVKKLLKNPNYLILGVDSLNNYYSVKLKKRRLNILKKKKKFIFFKKDLSSLKFCKKLFKKNKIDIIFHIGGQAGVLYSFKNPKSYLKNNISATKNLIVCINHGYNQIKKFIFCSSSSVYGDQKKFPLTENMLLNPLNPYALSKKKCEDMILSKLRINNNLKDFAIFRLFTVFGPYGRPDMFLIKLLLSFYKKKIINIYNFGNYFRDFTYIDDVIKIFILSLKKKTKGNIFNICSSSPIKIIDFFKIVKSILKKDIKVKLLPKRYGEVIKTHGSNQKLFTFFKIKKFSPIKKSLQQSITWFKSYKNKNELIV